MRVDFYDTRLTDRKLLPAVMETVAAAFFLFFLGDGLCEDLDVDMKRPML